MTFRNRDGTSSKRRSLRLDRLKYRKSPGTLERESIETPVGSGPVEIIDGDNDDIIFKKSTLAGSLHDSGFRFSETFKQISIDDKLSILSLPHQNLYSSRFFWSIIVWFKILTLAVGIMLCVSLSIGMSTNPQLNLGQHTEINLEDYSSGSFDYVFVSFVLLAWLGWMLVWMVVGIPISKLST